MQDGSSGSHNWQTTRHYSNKCYFCHAEIEWNGLSMPTGKAFLDRLDCEICRTPVCDRCGTSSISSSMDGDLLTRHRICKICQDKGLKPEVPQKPLYCMACQTRLENSVVFFCLCNRTVCEKCRVVLDGRNFCKDCEKEYLETAAVCHACKRNLYAFQTRTIDHPRKDHNKRCPGCGNKFCPECCSSLRVVKNRINSVCNECAPKFRDPNADDDTGDAKSILTSIMDKAKNWLGK